MRALTGLVDVHHHFLPSEYREAMDRSGTNPPDGISELPEWSGSQAIELIDHLGIATAFVSISSPGVLLDGCGVVDLAHMVNDAAAELITTHPGRFGSFATLPLPDIDGSLAEIERALDELRLDGVTLLTHYGGHYLGDPHLDAVLDELHRRKATVFVHPTSPLCCEQTSLGYPSPIMEFMFDTARAVINLIFSGSLDRFPDISWIIPHAGGPLPVLANRIEMMPLLAPERCHACDPVLAYLRRFHYDLAGPRTDEDLQALLGISDPSRLLYGSDYPFTPEFGVSRLLELLSRTTILDRHQLDGVLSGNAHRLLPRLET